MYSSTNENIDIANKSSVNCRQQPVLSVSNVGFNDLDHHRTAYSNENFTNNPNYSLGTNSYQTFKKRLDLFLKRE